MHPLLILISAGLLTSVAANAAGKSKTPSTDPAKVTGLTQVIENQINGLALDPPELRVKLLHQGGEYLEYRKKRPKLRDRQARQTECREQDAENPFCELLVEGTAKTRRKEASEKKRRTKDFYKTWDRLNKLQISKLKDAAPTDLSIAVQRLKKAPLLKKIGKATLAETDCPPTALLTGLGMQLEKHFPEVESKVQTTALYRRATECGNDVYSIRASYRLGLISLWDQSYEEADKHFARILEKPEEGKEFRSRVAYWRYYAAEKLKNSSVQNSMKDLLKKEYPLSLHALLVGASPGLSDLPWASTREPEVLFRSAKKSELNLWIRAAEILHLMNSPDNALDSLEAILDDLDGTEPEFQMYVAVLLMRSGEALRKFQVIANVIHDRPEYISKATLEMLYPLRRIDIIEKNPSKLDPLLVISLIRQESAFNERARSRAGAMGLMQIMPSTARRMERIKKNALFDPEVNVRLGSRYFSRLLKRYEGDTELALAAYNAGPKTVEDWKKRYPVENRMLFLDMVPFRETREYVASIARNYYWYLSLYGQKYDRQPSSPMLNQSIFKLYQPASSVQPVQVSAEAIEAAEGNASETEE